MHSSVGGPEHREGAVRTVSEDDGIVAVCVEGEFDLTNVQALADEIERALESRSSVILDLSEATFVDSSVIHVLVRSAQSAEERERVMVLQLGTAAIVERVLKIARIERVLPRVHDRQQAVSIIRRRGDAG